MRSAGSIARTQAFGERAVDGRFYRRGLGVHAEPVPQHHRGREDHRERVGATAAGDVGGGAVHRLEKARPALAEGGRRQHADRAREHRGLVAEDVAEHVLGEDHVEVPWRRDQLHGRVVDQDVLEPHVRELLGVHPAHDLAPQPRGLEHVRLVDARHATARGLERRARDPLDLGDRVLAGVVRALPVASARAEVDAPGELAHDQQVGALDDLAAQRAGVVEGRERAHRAEVGVEPQALAQAQQALLGTRRVRVGGVPARAADGREQHRVGLCAGGQRLIGERRPVGVDRRAAEQVLLEGEVADRAEHAHRGGRDLRADAVAGQQRDRRGHAGLRALMFRRT